MDEAKALVDNVVVTRVISTIAIILVAIALYKGIVFLFNKAEEKHKTKLFTSSKGRTYFKLTKSILRYVILIITVLIVLQVNGIDVNSALTGVGILGVVFGLAIQDWIKDIIRGSSIISDDYFHVGDVVKYKNIEGKVLVIGLKTTKIQDLKTSNIVSIANRNIDEIEVVSNLIYVRIPIPYEVKVSYAEKAIEDIRVLLESQENIEDTRYIGVTELADSSVQYLLEVKCDPKNKLQVRRDTLKTILIGLDKNGIKVPYNQIDVHAKE